MAGQGPLMPEPMPPSTLVGQLRAGTAVLVVGAGLGAPPWRELLARLTAELVAGHHVEVIALDGEAGDAAAEHALTAWLEALREACAGAGVAPAQPRSMPAGAAEVQGLVTRLGDAGEGGDAAREALDRVEQQAREARDWALVIEIVMGRIEHAGDGPERARRLRELAGIYEVELGDLRRAFAAIITACHLAPGDDEVAGAAERIATGTASWAELVREASALAAEVRDPGLAARWWTRVGGWCATWLGYPDGAIEGYEAAVAADAGAVTALEALIALYAQAGRADDRRRTIERLAAAVERDPDKLDAALGLADVLVAEARAAHGTADAVARWQAVERRYRAILARHMAAIPDGRRAEIWARLGAAARVLGDPEAAEASFRRVLERAPLHDAALQGLVELAEAREDWRGVAERKRAQLDALGELPDSAAQRAKLYEQIGDLWSGPLGDAGAAITAYLQGLALAPGARGLLHKLLEAFTAQRQWRRALEMLERLAAHEPSPVLRARFHYAAGAIARDELDDGALAIDKLAAALDDAPLTANAFDALDDLLTARNDWRQLARAYRRQLERLGDAAPQATLVELWTRLGDLCLDHLGDTEAAIAAYQVAAELAPDDAARHDQLAELHLAAGDAQRGDAIAALQRLLAGAPERVELYKALAGLYVAEHAVDKAWCVAQVLVLLGAASDDERRLFARYRPARWNPAQRRITDELWHAAILHPAEDRHVGAIFASALGGLAATTAQPVTAFGVTPEARADLDRDPRPVSRMIKHVTAVLAIDPAPMVWLGDGGAGLRIAHTFGLGAEHQRLVPSLLVGAPQLAQTSERVLAFEVGKRMAYLRPDRFVALAVATLPRLEVLFAAALAAGGQGGGQPGGQPGAPPGDPRDDVQKLAAVLRAQVPGPLLERIGELSAGLPSPTGGLVAGWRAATDLTANRAGFIVANDLEAAAHAIATEGATLSGLAAKERLLDLLGYAASERYFAVRRHLGQHVHDGDAA
jgi:tetratricopeptide (TPR) repeat protein